MVSKVVINRDQGFLFDNSRYKEQWFKHLRDQLQWSEKKIEEWAQSLYRRTGIFINVTEYL